MKCAQCNIEMKMLFSDTGTGYDWFCDRCMMRFQVEEGELEEYSIKIEGDEKNVVGEIKRVK